MNLYNLKGCLFEKLQLAYKIGVIFCVFQGHRGKGEASAKRELRARGGSLTSPRSP